MCDPYRPPGLSLETAVGAFLLLVVCTCLIAAILITIDFHAGMLVTVEPLSRLTARELWTHFNPLGPVIRNWQIVLVTWLAMLVCVMRGPTLAQAVAQRRFHLPRRVYLRPVLEVLLILLLFSLGGQAGPQVLLLCLVLCVAEAINAWQSPRFQVAGWERAGVEAAAMLSMAIFASMAAYVACVLMLPEPLSSFGAAYRASIVQGLWLKDLPFLCGIMLLLGAWVIYCTHCLGSDEVVSQCGIGARRTYPYVVAAIFVVMIYFLNLDLGFPGHPSFEHWSGLLAGSVALDGASARLLYDRLGAAFSAYLQARDIWLLMFGVVFAALAASVPCYLRNADRGA